MQLLQNAASKFALLVDSGSNRVVFDAWRTVIAENKELLRNAEKYANFIKIREKYAYFIKIREKYAYFMKIREKYAYFIKIPDENSVGEELLL